jgi:DNA-damage-inducible protein J
MATTTIVQAKVDAELKEEASIVLEAIGLDISDAVRLMLTRIVAEQALPFELHVPNETTIAAIQEARAGKLHSAANFDDLMAQLNADD